MLCKYNDDSKTAEFRFYGELNDFLLPEQQRCTLTYRFKGSPGIKDPIEVFAVPHTEVALIIVNGQSKGFDYQLQSGDRAAIYPDFNCLDISDLQVLPNRNGKSHPRFVVDVNLGKLAKRLRLFGFDCLYRNDFSDDEIVQISVQQQRVVLTRDRRLLFAKQLEDGYWVRAVEVNKQLYEVFSRFGLHDSMNPFARCMQCNGLLIAVDKEEILHLLEPKTKRYYQKFYRCNCCHHIYWKGSHFEKMQLIFAQFH